MVNNLGPSHIKLVDKVSSRPTSSTSSIYGEPDCFPQARLESWTGLDLLGLLNWHITLCQLSIATASLGLNGKQPQNLRIKLADKVSSQPTSSTCLFCMGVGCLQIDLAFAFRTRGLNIDILLAFLDRCARLNLGPSKIQDCRQG